MYALHVLAASCPSSLVLAAYLLLVHAEGRQPKSIDINVSRDLIGASAPREQGVNPNTFQRRILVTRSP